MVPPCPCLTKTTGGVYVNICKDCENSCEYPCAAAKALLDVYNRLRNEERTEIIKTLRVQLDLQDAEVADDLRVMAEQIIAKFSEFGFITEYDIKIGYVRCYEQKTDKGKTVNADCRKINKIYKAYLPYDFIITFYEPNVDYMTENQRKILMLHELKHVGLGLKGPRIEQHDIEDFADILTKFGLDWNWIDKEVPDILAGGDVGK
jgi:hypothetical protein